MMNRSGAITAVVLVISAVSGLLSQTPSVPTDVTSASAIVDRIMAASLSRCYSKVQGVTRIEVVPATDEAFAQIRSLGEAAVKPLTKYVDLRPKNDITQLFAVKFLIAIGTPSTMNALERAFLPDQWEVTRAQALSGMYMISREQAKPFVKRGLTDDSRLVRARAEHLWELYISEKSLPN